MNDVLKWLSIAKNDVISSKILHDNKCYSQSYFFFQQATEKGYKALLMLSGNFGEKELKKFSHNQFRPLRKAAYKRKENFDLIMSIDENISFLSENPLLKNADLNEESSKLDTFIKFIDESYSLDLVNIDEEELCEMLEFLKDSKNSKITLHDDYKVRFKNAIKEYIGWLKNFESLELIDERNELERIISNHDDFEKYIQYSMELTKDLYTILYSEFVLLFCTTLTIQHSSSTRYPDDDKKTNPIDLYNLELPIVKRQVDFLIYLEDAINKLIPFSENYTSKIDEAIEVNKKVKKKNNNFLPDTSWNSFGIKNLNDFMIKQFVPKNCHKEVPEQIIKELEFSEKLQEHSYFYYPMYCDAFSRQTRIFEMAIKSRSKTLNIDTRNKSLKNLIDTISVNYNEDYKTKLDWGRKMRNYNAHPEKTSLYGIVLKMPLIRMTNIINDVFRDPDFFEYENTQLKKVTEDFKEYKNGLWKFGKHLVHSIQPLAVRNNIVLWEFHLVYNKFPQYRDDVTCEEPCYVYTKNQEAKDGDFFGINTDNVSMKIERATEDENINILDIYKKQFNSSPTEVKELMNMHLNQNVYYRLEHFKHFTNPL